MRRGGARPAAVRRAVSSSGRRTAALAVGLLALAACSAGTGSTASTPGSSTPAASVTASGTTAGTAPPKVRESAGCATVRANAAAAANDTLPRSGGPPVAPRHETIAVDGTDRTYTMVAPAATPSTEPAPLIVAVHGFGSSAFEFGSLTGLDQPGAAGDATVLLPDGIGPPRTWQTSGSGRDAAFIDAMLDDVERRGCYDLDRVFMTGFSAGSAFTIAYACAHQDRIAAIATGAVDFQLGCKEPMPIIAFHGTADPAVPYDDGAIGMSLPGVKVRGTELNMSDWAKLDGCTPTPTITEVGTEVTKRVWSGCAPGTDVELYSIKGGGHTWAGADPSRGLGLTTQQVSATKELVRFFAAHPHRSS